MLSDGAQWSVSVLYCGSGPSYCDARSRLMWLCVCVVCRVLCVLCDPVLCLITMPAPLATNLSAQSPCPIIRILLCNIEILTRLFSLPPTFCSILAILYSDENVVYVPCPMSSVLPNSESTAAWYTLGQHE